MTGQWVVLEPLDTLTVRDGRSFAMGVDSNARLALPSPATFAGAVGALYSPTPGLAHRDRNARGRELPSAIRGPITVRRTGSPVAGNSDMRTRAWEAMLPVPGDVLLDDEETPYRLGLSQRQDDVRHDAESDVELLLTDPSGDGEPAGGRWWDTDQLESYLHEGTLSEYWLNPRPWELERRVGIARDENRTAAEHMFYSAEHIRPEPGVGFAGYCAGGPARDLSGTIPFGGESRRAEVHGNQPPVRLPAVPGGFPGGRLLLYLATPAVFPGGRWHPGPHGWPPESGTPTLAAAATGTPRVITTGSPDRRSGEFTGGRLMWAVPSGAVYYLRFANEAAAAAAAAAVHGKTLPQAEDWMTTAGFGLVFTGRWTEG